MTAQKKTVCIGAGYLTLNQKQIISFFFLFFFYLFGIEGFKYFIVQGDRNTIKNILNGIEKMTRTDKKLALVNIKFSMDAYKKLNKNEFNSLSDTALDFFHFVQSFGIKLKILDFVNPWLLEDQI